MKHVHTREEDTVNGGFFRKESIQHLLSLTMATTECLKQTPLFEKEKDEKITFAY